MPRLLGLRDKTLGVALRAQWKLVRAAASSFVAREVAAARVRLAHIRGDVTIDRDEVDRLIRDAAPPGVPFEAVVLRGSDLAARFPDGPSERRSGHLHGKIRLTHRSITTPTVIVIALYSDVAADYFVESMAADVAEQIDDRYGAGTALADAHAAIPVLLKEIATAAGLGVIGKNALFFSRRYGFNCKLQAIFLTAPVSRFDPPPTTTEWRLADCTTCRLCVDACPVNAFDDYTMNDAAACDRFIASDYFGPRRDHMCRACITRCPVSNDVLQLRRREGAPHRVFWDNEAQLALAADLFMYRPSFWVWAMQRFYYGAALPGRAARAKKTISSALTASVATATSQRSRDGWRLVARRGRPK